MKVLIRPILIAIGFISLILGVIGIFVPLLPTTPFVLLAAACFAKSSPSFHAWLIHHPLAGPMIKNWHENGAIPKKVKIIATIAILFSVASIWLWAKVFAVKVGVSLLLASVIFFILTRPEGM